jgi:hypothetical protein
VSVPGRRVRSALVALVLLCAGGATAAPAGASPGQFTTFEAPAELLSSGDGVRVQTLTELQALGVDSIRMTMYWQNVAPSADARQRPRFDATDPAAYTWGAYGRLADEVHARGMRLLVAVTGPVPRWATAGAKDHLTNPSPGDYKALMTAVGRRFGAETYAFSVWNEPNLSKFLAPQFAPGGRAVSPALYRRLFFAGYDGLRAAGVRAPVLAGETAPVGNDITVAPLRFLRGVLCLNESYRPTARCPRLPAAGWAVHPYMRPAFPTAAPPGPDDVTIGGLGRLGRALDRAAAAGMVARNLPIYATEFGVQSHPNVVAGLPLATQADYRSVAEFLAYGNPRVVSFAQYLLTDPAPLPGPSISRYVFQMGLYLFKGHQAKPAYDAFRLPLVVRRRGASVSLWGLVRPARLAHTAGTVTVEYLDAHSAQWRVLSRPTFGSSGYWTGRGAWRDGRHWRVEWTGLGGALYTGPATAAYAF